MSTTLPCLRGFAFTLGVAMVVTSCSRGPSGTAPAFEKQRLPPPGVNNVWYEYNDSDTVVVFVHGILSDSRSCWRYEDSDDRAKNQYWPELVRTDKSLDAPAIFLAGYHTSVDSGIATMTDAAFEVRQGLKNSLQGRTPALAKRKIIFITHSTGGIVVRYLLDRYSQEFKDKIIGLMLIASPSGGSQWANYLSGLIELYRNKMAAELKIDNDMLKDVDSRFRDLVYHQTLPYLVGVEAFENYFVFHRKWFPDRWQVVDESSAARYFGAGRLLPGTDHFGVVKPPSVEHPAHKLLVEFYRGDFTVKVTQVEQPLVQSRDVINITEGTSAELAKRPLLEADQITVSGVDFHAVKGAQLRANRVVFRDHGRIIGEDFALVAAELSGGLLSADGLDGEVGRPGGPGGRIVVWSSRIADTRISARGGHGGRGQPGSPVGQSGGAGGEILVVTGSSGVSPAPDVTGGRGGEGMPAAGSPAGLGASGPDGRALVLAESPVRAISISGNTDQLRTQIDRVVQANLSAPNVLKNAQVQFQAGSAQLSPDERSKLDSLAAMLKQNDQLGVVVAPSGDLNTPVDFNLAIQQRRAASVRDYLFDQGVAQKQISSISSGSTKAVMPNRTSGALVSVLPVKPF